MQFFKYGQKEIEYLTSKDKKLGLVIEKIGMLQREINPEPFSALIASVVSQQISKKAAATVWNRLAVLLGSVTPDHIIRANLADIQGCGMSAKKAGYIHGIARAATTGTVNFDELPALSDEVIIKQLSSLNGVGVWSAEMLLIFSLCRPDVVSYGDLAIRRGMMKLYGLNKLPRDKFERYRKRYSPYGSVAALYLWELSVT